METIRKIKTYFQHEAIIMAVAVLFFIILAVVILSIKMPSILVIG